MDQLAPLHKTQYNQGFAQTELRHLPAAGSGLTGAF